MNDYETFMERIQIEYELTIKKAVILQMLEILRQAVRRRMGDKYVTYKGVRMEDVLNFLIEALIDYDIGESKND